MGPDTLRAGDFRIWLDHFLFGVGAGSLAVDKYREYIGAGFAEHIGSACQAAVWD